MHYLVETSKSSEHRMYLMFSSKNQFLLYIITNIIFKTNTTYTKQGVVDGVTGVFTKPIEGARDEGASGFFKGLGMGAVGLVARPTAGVVDFASGSFDAVKR